MNKIIFGGGFDPIHLGHINMAKVAKEAIQGEVIFVPAKVAVWKEDSIDKEHKLNMLKLSIESEEGFSIDAFELEQEEQPRSYLTVEYFKKKYPKDKLFFLIGQDQVNSFHLWAKPEVIASKAQIIYYERPKCAVNQENIDRFHMIPIKGPIVDVSSSEIRDLKSVLVKESVLKYIEDNELYFINKIKSHLKEKRYLHSLSVAHLAYNIAKKHGLDYQKAYIAGILHDIAKEIDKAESLVLMKQYYPEYVDIGAFSYHQFLGAKIAKEEFMVVDEEILGAIMFHTTGKANMSRLEKLIYAIDKIDPTRGYDSTELIKAMEEDVDKGFITVLKANKEYLAKKEIKMHNRLDDECTKWYLEQD